MTATGEMTTGGRIVLTGSVRGMSTAVEAVVTDPAKMINLPRNGIDHLAGMTPAEIAAARTRTETEIETAAPGTVIAAAGTAAVGTGAVETTTNETPNVAGVEMTTVAISVATMGTAAPLSVTRGELIGRRTKIDLVVPPRMARVPRRRHRRSKIRPSQDKLEETAQATATDHRTMVEMIGKETMLIIAVVTITTGMTEETGTAETGVTEKMSVEAADEKANGAVGAVVDLLRDPPDITAQTVPDLVPTALAQVIDPHPPKAEGMITTEAVVVDTEATVIAETEIEIIEIGAGAKEVRDTLFGTVCVVQALTSLSK
mmetsp:Transcript_1170/g.3337  ORF Transcript_1170/g.3337 Transcript_1170/m.3337 type:complete len:316 (+) Transcript_1170:1580-2527(+)